MTEKTDQEILTKVIEPMRKQLEQQIEAVYLEAAKRLGAVWLGDKGAHEFTDDMYGSDDDRKGDEEIPYLDELRGLVQQEAKRVSDAFAARLDRDYDDFWDITVDRCTAAEVRAEREAFEARNRESFQNFED